MPTLSSEEIAQAAIDRLGRSMSSFITGWGRGEGRPASFLSFASKTIKNTVAHHYPTQPAVTIDPKDNTGAGWLIGFGVLLILGGIYGLGSGESWALLTAGIGILLLVLGARAYTTEAEYKKYVEETRQRARSEWEQGLRVLTEEVSEAVDVRLHVNLALHVGVPSRALSQFVKESRDNANVTRYQWRVDWWAALPEYPPPPARATRRLSHDAYEEYCAAWLRSWGWTDAVTTRFSRDGGVDVRTSVYVVQCKHYDGGYVGAPAVREIFGVGQAEHRRAMVITSGRFTADAREFAKRAGVALIHLDDLTGVATPLNEPARAVIVGPSHL